MQKKDTGESKLELTSRVIASYETARGRGMSRFDAFCHAVMLYCSEQPGLPVSSAGSEVARLLAAAARAEVLDNAGKAVLTDTPDGKYANVT